jgi:hypothetical protein
VSDSPVSSFLIVDDRVSQTCTFSVDTTLAKSLFSTLLEAKAAKLKTANEKLRNVFLITFKLILNKKQTKYKELKKQISYELFFNIKRTAI